MRCAPGFTSERSWAVTAVILTRVARSEGHEEDHVNRKTKQDCSIKTYI